MVPDGNQIIDERSNELGDEELSSIVLERKKRIFNARNLVFLFISISLIVFLFTNLDLTRTIETLKNADVALLICAVFIYSCSNFFKMLRFRALVANSKISMMEFYSIVSYHNFFNQIMPARTGELTYVYYLKKIGRVQTTRGLHSLIITRIFDLIIISIYFVISLLFFYGARTSIALFFTGIACGIVSIVALFKISINFVTINNILKKIAGKLKINDYKITKLILDQMENITAEFDSFNTQSHIPLLFITSALVWLALYFFSYVNILALRIHITFIETLLGSTGAVLTNVLPINSFGSFGTLEAGWTGGFVLVGMNLQDAITSGFASHIITFFASAFLAVVCKIILKFIKTRSCP